MGYERTSGAIWAAPRSDRDKDESATGEQRCSDANELPSVVLTTRFLALCRQYGSEQLAVRIVASGRSAGTPGLPQNNDWTAWTSDEMRAAVEHLGRKLHT